MSEFDGEIVISASIDTTKFSKDSRKLTNKLESQNEALERQKIIVESLINSYDTLKQKSLKKFKSEDLFDNETVNKLYILSRQIDLAEMKEERLNSQILQTKQSISDLSKSSNINFSGLRNKINDVIGSISNFSKRIFNLAGSAIIFNAISSGFREIEKSISNVISKDSVLSSSLNSIKTNLITAFAPIYQAILPALRELGKMLSFVTLQLASFVSMLFGKTLRQSQILAEGIIQTAESYDKSSSSIKNQSNSISNLSKATKKARRELASFDKLNILVKNNSSKASKAISPISNKSGKNITPIFGNLDEKQTNVLAEAIEKLKKPFNDLDFSKLNDSLNSLKTTLGSFGKKTGERLLWIYENILAPLSGWTITEVLPRFLDILNSSLQSFEPLDEQIANDLKFLWDTFLEPASKWVGSKITYFLDGLNESIKKLGKGLKNNRKLLEFLSAFFIGLASSAILVGIAKLTTLLPPLINLVSSLTVAMLTNPWTWAVVGISALITVIILITKHWDTMEKYFVGALDSFKKAIYGIESIFSGFVQNLSGWVEIISGILTGDLGKAWQGVVDIVFGALRTITGGIRGIQGIIESIINSVLGGINFLIDKINGVGISLPDWLGGRLNIPRLPNMSRRSYSANAIPYKPVIPRLAQGAVLDGGNPMLAYLNDQPRGQTNIETPLQTMIEAFNTALSNRTTGNVTIEANGDINQLISFLNLKLKQENERIGGRMVKGDVWV